MIYVESVKFKKNPVVWNHAFKSEVGMMGKWMRSRVNQVEQTAEMEAPSPGGTPRNRTGINYATGQLVAGLFSHLTYYGTDNDLEGVVGSTAPHTGFVLKGTMPHIIRPRRADALKFFWHKVGHNVSFQIVHHPGTAANDFLQRALNQVIGMQNVH